MALHAEETFAKTFINTLSSQPVTYQDDYQQPGESSLKRVPIIPIPVPPVPQSQVQSQSEGSSSAAISVTFKSSKPPASYTLSVQPTDTISSIKAQLAAVTSAPPVDAQRLLLKGKALADNKLVKEYNVKDGDTVNLMIKPGFEWDPNSAVKPPVVATPSPISQPTTPMTLSLDPAAPTGARKHQRIPSVVLSPSPSGESPGLVEKPITLTLDTPLTHEELSTFHQSLARPEFWDKLFKFVKSEFPIAGVPVAAGEADSVLVFEDFLRASKATLTAHEIAKIRDHVGVIGMAGT